MNSSILKQIDENYLSKFFNTISKMNETNVPDTPTQEEMEILKREIEYLENGIERTNNSFKQKHPQPDESSDPYNFDKNMSDNIILLTKIVKRLANSVDKLTKYTKYCITDPEIDAHVIHHTNPHTLRIMHVENLVKLTNQNMKSRDERIKELMDDSDFVQDKLTEINTKIDNYEKQLTINNRSSTPFGDISVINNNKNLRIPIFSCDNTDKPLKFLHEIKEYVEAHGNTDFKVIISNSLKKNGVRLVAHNKMPN